MTGYLFWCNSHGDRKVFPENDHFTLKLHILASLCRPFSNHVFLKSPLFTVKNNVSFFRNYLWTSFYGRLIKVYFC